MGKLSAKELAYNKIKEDIINQELLAGDKIIEEHYAEKLGISRTPLREAIRNLEQDGFLNTIRNRGAFVKSFDKEEEGEYFLLRKLLEPIMVVEASKNQTPELLEKIEKTLILSENETDPIKVAEHINDFHGLLKEMSGMKYISTILSHITDYTKMIVKENVSDKSRLKEVNREHRVMFEHIKNQNHDILRSITELHVLNSVKSYTEKTEDNE